MINGDAAVLDKRLQVTLIVDTLSARQTALLNLLAWDEFVQGGIMLLLGGCHEALSARQTALLNFLAGRVGTGQWCYAGVSLGCPRCTDYAYFRLPVI